MPICVLLRYSRDYPGHSYDEMRPFGVAFDKRIMFHSGATPVHYVARNAKHRCVGSGRELSVIGLIICARRSRNSLATLPPTLHYTMVPRNSSQDFRLPIRRSVTPDGAAFRAQK